MRKLWHYLVNHVRQDFHLTQYLLVLIFIFVCIIVNYYLDFEDSIIDHQTGFRKFILFFLTHAGTYIIPVLLAKKFKPDLINLNRQFWIRSMFALTLLSADRSFLFLESHLFALLNTQLFVWGYKVINNLSGTLYIILPFLIFYILTDRSTNNFYGLTKKPNDLKPYFILLAIMVPIIIGASFLPGFQKQYPMYVSTTAHDYLGVPEWLTVAGYELAYAINFVSIEFFYRGFLILGLTAFLGRSSILPMACLYCSLHFGKPMPEAISSIFGGYILGVIAFETKSIWGGILVHVGIAWLMEVIAFMQSSYNN
ncbi:MAG: CPBP family intramembrane metalloprotease [Cyclobacteriaceae bacterium]|nr:CPBP family intramembrane metalloprotease [Cyclobacteriaceae bacterium]